MPSSAAERVPTLAHFARSVLPTIRRTVSAERLLRSVSEIVENDRCNSFDGWHKTSARLQAAYEACGAASNITRVPTGGVRGSGKWIIPEAANVVAVELDLIEPYSKRLADFRECPWHAVQWSAATPSEGVIGELAAVESAEQMEAAKDGRLRGKIVLTRLDPLPLRRALAAAKVAGVVCDLPVAGCPEAVAWTKFGWGGLDLWEGAAPVAAVAVSSTTGDALRALCMASASVSVRMSVDVRRVSGAHDVVSGTIVGREDPDAEIWAVAHSCEPGALDNASGGAACVEIARVLCSLIRQGVLPPPRRTLRLLHAYECYGFFHYLEHVPRVQQPLAGVCIDTLGARPDLCQGQLSWHASVPGSAQFTDDIGFAMLASALEAEPLYALHRKPFLSTEDTLLSDPKYGFPCPWITNHPFRGYHSSADTIDLIDGRGLSLCTAAMAGYLYFLADAGTDAALELAEASTVNANHRLREATDDVSEVIVAEHQQTLARLRQFATTGSHTEVSRRFNELRTAVSPRATPGKSAIASQASTQTPRALTARIPLRRLPLAPTPENVWPHVRERFDPRVDKWALYWADGERDISRIRALAALHSNGAQDADRIASYFDALAVLGFVDLHDPENFATLQSLTEDLRRLGVADGMDVMVHSSLRAIGPVRGGAETVVDALLEAVGPRGTLLAPSFNHFEARVFNPLTTPTTNGAISQAIWRRPGARRSLHPSHSVAAIGPRSDAYLADHLAHGAWSMHSPIGRLIANGGYILSIGVGHDRTTAYHLAEVAIGVPCLDSLGSRDEVILPTGERSTVAGLAWREAECPVDPAGIDALLRDKQSHGTLHKARITLARAKDVFDARIEQLGNRCATCPIRPEFRNLKP